MFDHFHPIRQRAVDSDRSGLDTANKLKSNLYQGHSSCIITVGDVCNLPNAEVEDLFPASFLTGVITNFLRIFPQYEDDIFASAIEEDKPIIPQIEAYAKKYDIRLELGWKVEVAKRAKSLFLRSKNPMEIFSDIVEVWNSLFTKIII